MTDQLDARLCALLAATERAPDTCFTYRVRQSVLVEERLRRARRRSWLRFAMDAGGSAAILVVFILIMNSPQESGKAAAFGLTTPVMAATLLLGLWITLGLRSPGRG